MSTRQAMTGGALASVAFVGSFLAISQMTGGQEGETATPPDRVAARSLRSVAQEVAGLSPSARLPALQKERKPRRGRRTAPAPPSEPAQESTPDPESAPVVSPTPAPEPAPAPAPRPKPQPSPPPVRFYDEG